MEFPVALNPAAAVLSLDVAPDLSAWQSAAAAGIVPQSDGSRWRVDLPPAIRFVRLRAELQ